MLGSSNNDRQLQKRHKMLRRELSNLDWNGFVVRDVLEVHVCTLIVSFRNFRVLDDFGRDWTRQNLDLWDRVWAVSMSAVMSFALVFILLHDMSMGFVRTNHGDLFCSHVKSVHGLTVGCEWVLHVCIGLHHFVLSDTLKFGWSHITCQDVRHASWGNKKCDLCRKCESSVKVCVTHLRMRRSEFVFFLEWLSCGIWMQR